MQLQTTWSDAGRGHVPGDIAWHLIAAEHQAFNQYVRKGITPVLPIASTALLNNFLHLTLAMEQQQETTIAQAIINSTAVLLEAAARHREDFQAMLATQGVRTDSLLRDEPYLPLILLRQQQLWLRGIARAAGLNFSGVVLKANTDSLETRLQQAEAQALRRLRQQLDQCRQPAAGVRQYVWRSRDDGKVRYSHAAHDDQVFSWDQPPPGGHPGEAFNCRCYAEPVLTNLGQPVVKKPDPLDTTREAINVALLALAFVNPATGRVARALTPEILSIARQALAIARTAAARAGEDAVPLIRRLRQLDRQIRRETYTERDLEGLSKYEKNQLRYLDGERRGIFTRPKGVPKDWLKDKADDGAGVMYYHPKKGKGDSIRIAAGNKNDTRPKYRKDFVKQQINGNVVDRFGNKVEGTSPEAHIPLKDFKFDIRKY